MVRKNVYFSKHVELREIFFYMIKGVIDYNEFLLSLRVSLF